MDAEDVVVGREHTERGFGDTGLGLDSDLGIVNTREVARTGWLVFFWLERERVRVHTGRWGAGVVNEWLHLVEVLTGLFLESVLAVEDQFEGVQSTVVIFGELGTFAEHEWGTNERIGDEAVRHGAARDVGSDGRVGVGGAPRIGTVIEAEDEFLDWVVVRQALLHFGTRGDGIGTGVLHLLDEVFVTLLGETASLFGVQVDVVRPDLEGGAVGDGREGARQIEVETDFVVLERDEWQRQTWVAVEEEDQWQKDFFTGLDRGGHLTVVGLLGFVKVQLRVQTPPLLVVLVDALTTDGQFNILDHALGQPGIIGSRGGTRDGFDVHVRDEITVARDGDGNATVGTWGTVDSLFDVFHREVRVTLVHGLEESDFWVARQVDVLGTVGDELHETTGHFESFCTIYRENNFAKKLSLIFPGIMYIMSQPEQTKPLDVVESESESEYETESDVGVVIDEDGSQPMEMYEDEDELADFLEDDAIMKIANIAGSLFASEEGDTVCTALVNISKQLEMQNRIMVKILSQMQKST